MASLIGSIKNLTSDSWWFVKIGLYSGALFFILNQGYFIPPRLTDDAIRIFLIGLFFIFFGIASVTIHRNINNISPIFPGPLNFFEILIKGIFATIAAIPGILLSYVVFSYLQTFTFEYMFVIITVYVITTAILSAFIFIPVVLVSVRGNLFDMFRLDILFKGAGNYIVQFLSYMIQYAIIIGGVTVLLYYFTLEMLGDHPALLYLKSLIIVLTFFSLFSYSSDLYGDAIPEMQFKEGRKKVSKEEAKAQKMSKVHADREKRAKLRNNKEAKPDIRRTRRHSQQAADNSSETPKTPRKIVRPHKPDQNF